MRLLLDENVPVRLALELTGHEVDHIRDVRWSGLADREIVRRAQGVYDGILTLDQTFDKELLGLEDYPAIIILVARSHRLRDVRELLPQLAAALSDLRPSRVIRISRPPAVLP
jgi:predicted nuclease of predicted toxin-antitoxin system